MHNIKILHIHTDPKFIKANKLFDMAGCINDSIEIDLKIASNRKFRNILDDIVKLCNNYNIVVIHQMDFPKSYITVNIDKDILVIWRFFGAELYAHLPKVVYTKKTLKYSNKKRFKLLRKVKQRIIWGYDEQSILQNAILRANYFLGIAKEEYNFLSKYFYLPKFLQISLSSTIIDAKPFNPAKDNLIIIGNNRSSYNNHLDIFEKIKLLDSNNLEYLLFFSYGYLNKYTEKVKMEAQEISNLKIVEEFLSKESYYSVYDRASALVINAHRQMAMHNIFTALGSGVKVYLNEKNPMVDFFHAHDLYTFNINDLQSDLQTNSFKLSYSEFIHNQSMLKNLKQKFSLINFHKELREITR